MDLTQLANLGELIGGVAVIASLLYLAFQVRQNTVHSRAYSQRDMLTEITGDILRILLEPGSFMSARFVCSTCQSCPNSPK